MILCGEIVCVLFIVMLVLFIDLGFELIFMYFVCGFCMIGYVLL